MRNIVIYDKASKTLHCENKEIIPQFCLNCIEKRQNKCLEFYEKLIKSNKEGLFICPYKFAVYFKNNTIYTSIILKNKDLNKIKDKIEKSGQKINNFHLYSEDEIINYLNDFEDIKMENIILRDCMHDLRNIGGFFYSMKEEVKLSNPEIIEKDNIKALLSLYDLVNYRINILNGVRTLDNRRIRQKMHPIIKKITTMLSYQARKKDIVFIVDSVQNKYVDLSNNMYLAIFILLENAVKHSFSNSYIKISFKEENDYILTSIENIGALIYDNEKDEILKRGYRGKNTKTKGSGIGLSLAKEILDQHNCDFSIVITKINSYQSKFVANIKMKCFDA